MILVIGVFNLLILRIIIHERKQIYGTSVVNNIRIKIKPSLDLGKKVFSDEGSNVELERELERENALLYAFHILISFKRVIEFGVYS